VKSESDGAARQTNQATVSSDGNKAKIIPAKKSGVIELLHHHNGAVVQRWQIATLFYGEFVKSFTMSC
jgi:hypothetical protein